MSELRAYLIEAQQSPSSTLFHRVGQSPIDRIVQQFSEDMDLLRRALPAGATLSASSRVKFVLGKKPLSEIRQRLQERKTSIQIILSTMGRYYPLSDVTTLI